MRQIICYTSDMVFLVIIFLFFFQILGGSISADVLSAQKDAQEQVAESVSAVTLKNTTFAVEIADDDEERARGLMYREKLAKNQGMLFVFPKEEPRAFWMKNTLIPLDMIFLDGQQTIVSIQKQAKPCGKQPVCPLYESRKPAKYVLEINGGVATKLKLKEGEKITLDGI